jgi:phosphoribosylaminoimidazolecarboxamide formyltransferase/IMP cyclohydrolase
MHESTIIQRALLTVYDKTHIIELAEALHLRGIELISTGNTAKLLKEHGIPVTAVSDYTGYPEMMDGRVKTLHPKVHGGILGRRDIDADVMIAHNIPDIDLVVVNLYPFEKVTQKTDVTLADAIENIDIGGPTLIRGAAKNNEWCTVLVDPNDYQRFIDELKANDGAVSDKARFAFAAKAFAHTAAYDANIADYFAKQNEATVDFSPSFILPYKLKETLRYGENPHQQAAFYQAPNSPSDSIAKANMLQGKMLSFNNIVDADTALECVKTFDMPACVIVKHANPCGAALGEDARKAYDRAYVCDPMSAFGGIIAFNREVDENLLTHIFAKQFVEVLIAPSFTQKALEIAKQKPDCRLLAYQASDASIPSGALWDVQSVGGGLLVQTTDKLLNPLTYDIVTEQKPSDAQLKDLIFSWQLAKFVKSNAIVYVKNGQTVGIGAGQMSRIMSTEIAAIKARQQQLDLQGAVMASDAFFPFTDNIEKAYEYGIRAVIQPGGSKKDPEVIAMANQLGMVMLLTGMRHFRH